MIEKAYYLLLGLLFVCSVPLKARPVDLKGLPDFPAQPVTEATWHQSDETMRWMSRNFSVKPSLIVARGGSILDIPPDGKFSRTLDQRVFVVPGVAGPLKLADALTQAKVDAYLVLKNGKLLYEQYFQGFDEHSHHSWYSGAKSLVGMLVGNLVEDGLLDVHRPVVEYLPELKGSAYERVTVRQALNMTAGLAYTEDPEAMVPGHFRHEYLKRAGMLPPYDVLQQTLDPTSASIPRGVRGLMPLVEASKTIQPGQRFEYQNINVDVMGWLIESVTGQRLEKTLATAVWQKLGAEHDAFIPTDPNLTALTAGGFSSSARDAARFGLAVLNKGVLAGEQVFPAAWIENTCRYSAQDERVFANRQTTAGDFSSLGSIKAYRNYWYIHDRDQCAMASRGFGGQSVYINRASGVVIVTFASSTAAHGKAKNNLLYLTHLLANEV
jgi:CubicO group peptidase (beta-lactamase class C family)